MMIGAVSNSYDPYTFYTGNRAAAAGSGPAGVQGAGLQASAHGASMTQPQGFMTDRAGLEDHSVQASGDDHKVKKGYQSSPADCKTCRERKYQDGSNESDVSFKAPGHISPQASASTVMAHERQHVSNAYQKAAQKGGDVVSCSVSLHTAVCPECGTVYVSGGTTSTAISYPDESNPYQKNKKAQDAIRYVGANINYVA